MYDTILYPTDGSETAEAALGTVRDLSENFEATVHVLHVVDAIPGALGIGDDPNREASPGMVGDPEGADTPMGGDRNAPRETRARATTYGERVVEAVAHRLEGVETTTTVRGGDPSAVIPDHAEEFEADVVVMGACDRTGVDRYVNGSVTEAVLRAVDVPVLAVPYVEDPLTLDWEV